MFSRWAPAQPMTDPYLSKLNPQQRRAVEHGGSSLAEAGPLLIIAGAGSGKTNTLAHRVAHLIAQGADPRRMMLLTFSRRAASEMERRVEHITAHVFLLNAIDGCIPSDRATGTTAEIEEERRLLYVAMTRAKDHLHLI